MVMKKQQEPFEEEEEEVGEKNIPWDYGEMEASVCKRCGKAARQGLHGSMARGCTVRQHSEGNIDLHDTTKWHSEGMGRTGK